MSPPGGRVGLGQRDSLDGWAWIEDGLIVTFCGQACADFKDGAGDFHGVYGCPPES